MDEPREEFSETYWATRLCGDTHRPTKEDGFPGIGEQPDPDPLWASEEEKREHWLATTDEIVNRDALH